MKKIASYLLTCLFATYSMGNVTPPKAYISEVFFDGSGNWTIELGFYSAYPLAEFDSIYIESSSGSSKIAFCSLVPGGGWPGFDSLAIITNANLVSPVTINPQDDYIKATSYMFGFIRSDYLPFGNYPGSLLNCRQNTASIAYNALWYQTQFIRGFCIDKSPTIGTFNDTTGAMASYSGSVYDSSGNLFPEGLLYIPQRQDFILYVHPDGSFAERVFAKRYTFDTI